MSRISNLTTIKIGLLRSWNSYWFDSYYYSYLLFGDLRIKDYITGIFYSLNTITDYLYIYRFISDSILIKTNLIFLGDLNYKSIYVDGLYKLDENFKFFYHKKIWNIFLSGLKLIELFNNDTIILGTTVPYGLFSNYYFMYNLLSYYLKNTELKLYNIVSNDNHLNYNKNNCGCNVIKFDLNCVELLENDLKFNILDLLVLSSVNKKYKKNLVSDENITEQLITINLTNSISYYASSYIHHIKNSVFTKITKGYINNYGLIESVKYLKNINHSISVFLIHLLILLKYTIRTLNFSYYFNLFKFGNLVTKLIGKNLFTNGFIINNYCYNEINTYSIRENITKSIVNSLRFNIEKSIYLFENKYVYFYFSLFFKKIPYLLSAKVITDFLVYMFESGNRIVKSFYYIRNLQRKFHKKRRELEYLFYSKKSEFQNKEKYTKKQTEIAVNFYKYVYQLAIKRFPLLGIRIECSGSFKKGKMARTYHYTSWIKDYLLTGSMPNNTLISDIDYYQYFTVLNSSSIGIKTWVFLETYLYNSNNMYVGIIY